jgi:primosomal protein N' (replication factor Y)
MGSATPSVEAWSLMNEDLQSSFIKTDDFKSSVTKSKDANTTIKKLTLTRRLAGGSIPEIKAVNLENTQGCLTKELKEEINATAAMGRQTILFLNRRGFAYFYHCKQCGYELKCKRCSVSLTWHKEKNKAVCHYCGYSVQPPKACPSCGSLEAGFTGFGTEMIEEEMRRTFPDLRIVRADSDTVTKKNSLKETLDKFRNREVDVLLGTQMVAKGLNFPGVRLVGVVLADTGLHLPDFRAAERTFSLIVQVAGRAGRYFPDGKVIVQTLRPNDPAIVKSCTMDIDGFFEDELRQREALWFPPFTRIIRFTIRSKNEAKANAACARLAQIAAKFLPKDADMLGPAECPLSVIANQHRRHIILRGKTMGALHASASRIIDIYEKGKDTVCYLEIDVDPVSLL